MKFLVLPRILALMVMMPLLCIYTHLVGMLAGLLIGIGVLDLSLVEYINETRQAVGLLDCGLGLGKGALFGALVALAGCLRGMQCGPQCRCRRCCSYLVCGHGHCLDYRCRWPAGGHHRSVGHLGGEDR
jgi:ABC-type transporter Mla maintaining outer membrane lipid asymmetry permease subunit MlaE